MNSHAEVDRTAIKRRLANADLIGRADGARQLTTPALLLDLPALRRNIEAMAAMCADAGLRLRPHAKTHKCASIAREQIAGGAVGVCCATPHEAAAMAREGIGGLLLTSPAVQPRHLAELAALHAAGSELTVVIDHPDGVAAWEAALSGSPRPLPAFVDIDIGMERTGARDPDAVVEIAKRIAASTALSYDGVQAYSGRVQHIEAYADRRATYLAQIARLEAALAGLGDAGLPPGIVSGCGTGTFGIDLEHGNYTEAQVGSYVVMDREYNEVELFADRPNPWEVSLVMRTTVISANAPGHVTLNAGFKSFATDGPEPVPLAPEGADWRYEFFGDEYGMLVIEDGAPRPALGDTVDLVTPHCDPTVNLHDAYHVVDGDRLVDIWPMEARGVL